MYAERLAMEISAHPYYRDYAHELLRLWLGDPAPSVERLPPDAAHGPQPDGFLSASSTRASVG